MLSVISGLGRELGHRRMLFCLVWLFCGCEGVAEWAKRGAPSQPKAESSRFEEARSEPQAEDGGAPSPSQASEGERIFPPSWMKHPVPFYEKGRIQRYVEADQARQEGYLLIDLGESWTPYLFSERSTGDEKARPNAYRSIFLALAREEWPADHHGDRAREDKYLEPYGIMPTLSVLRERGRRLRSLDCVKTLDLKPLQNFQGSVAYEDKDGAKRFLQKLHSLEERMKEIMAAQGVESPESIVLEALEERDRKAVLEYGRLKSAHEAILATQRRLECEGHFEGKGSYLPGAMDWATHKALVEFERKHRIYGWGVIARETLEMLRKPPLEGEREALIRVLTERAMHAAQVIEDGSVQATYIDSSGVERPVPNLEAQLRAIVIDAFGLDTPEGAQAFLENLGELRPDEERLAAIRMPPLP
ncbi:MAG: hypothetical protein NZM37_06190 [Sandaracinaceae bacterium]|nr:hypothetical protein [Sandaracinaceae bacterium]